VAALKLTLDNVDADLASEQINRRGTRDTLLTTQNTLTTANNSLATALLNTVGVNTQLVTVRQHLWNPTVEPIVLGAGTFIGQLTPLQDIVSIVQKNAPAATGIDSPCYVTGNIEQSDYSRPSDCAPRNKHRSYSADRVRASQTNFLSDSNNRRMENSYSGGKSFAQNVRQTNI